MHNSSSPTSFNFCSGKSAKHEHTISAHRKGGGRRRRENLWNIIIKVVYLFEARRAPIFSSFLAYLLVSVCAYRHVNLIWMTANNWIFQLNRNPTQVILWKYIEKETFQGSQSRCKIHFENKGVFVTLASISIATYSQSYVCKYIVSLKWPNKTMHKWLGTSIVEDFL